MAHEVSHIANRDLWIMGLADTMSRVVSLASWIGQLMLLINLPLVLAGGAHIPWHVPLLLIFSPTIMALLQLALSRTREFDADRGAAELTGDPGGLASALLKLERRTGRFWEDIFLPGRRIPEPSLLRTHPPTEDRVARLREIAEAQRRPPIPPARLRLPPMDAPVPPRFGPFGVFR
jgi:heat shock protein HtpX